MTAILDDATADPWQIVTDLQRKLDASTAELAQRNSEYGERIEQQSATIDVLKVMSVSPGDPQPVFDLIVRRAQELCNGWGVTLCEFDGHLVHLSALCGKWEPSAVAAYQAAHPLVPTRASITCRAILDRQVVHIRDIDAVPELLQVMRNIGWKSNLALPLLRDGVAIGAISLTSELPGGFSDSQVALLQTFAEQAVIAISSAETYRELRQRTGDLQEALEYQTATSDVLNVISRSTFDLQPVLDTLAETAARLCDAGYSAIFRRDGEVYRIATVVAFSPETRDAARKLQAFLKQHPLVPGRGSMTGRVALEGRAVHVADTASDPEYTITEATTLGNLRTQLGVPLLREGQPIGVIVVARQRVEPFTNRQVELVHTFADQAVIAMENARLITETREALEQQTATAEVLQVINSSPGEVAPVFNAMLEKAMRLCGAEFGEFFITEGEQLRAIAVLGVPATFAEFRHRNPAPPIPGSITARVLTGEPVIHVADVKDDDLYRRGDRHRRALVDLGGARTFLSVTLIKDRAVLGSINIYRQEVRLFSDKQIALLQSFAAQAVIAMENARLITETHEALEQQTATAEILQVINSSPGDLQPVFGAMLDKALGLCEADFGVLWTYDGERIHATALRGVPPTFAEYLTRTSHPVGPDNAHGRLLRGEPVVHIADVAEDTAYRSGDPIRHTLVELGGGRTLLAVPLRKDDTFLGDFVIYRQEVRPFSDKQITLLQNFAAQAVIAIENARLLDEIRQRQAELRVTFDNMADGVVMFDEDLRLAAWNRNFQQILDLPDALLIERPSYAEYLRILANRGEFGTDDIEAELSRRLEDTDQELRFERTRPDGRVIEVRRNAVPDGGFVLIYSDITERKRSEAEIHAARDAAEAAYRDLKAAQANLIQAEKMASLGQLTAGIAHEIKNPLNFVNNFAGLSVELLDELKETAAPAITALDDDKRTEIDETIEMLTGNLEKIAEHGRRADNIVKSMLEHSRGTSGERRQVDLNGLIEEALNLAYHGARAQDQNFNVTLERDFGQGITPIELVPQDITRVCLNLFSNGFYAATKHQRAGSDPTFNPSLKVSTRDLRDVVEIRVRDNGTGIAPEIKDKLFQPFFTTKPTGEGTGLGLSISYDIITQQHGGTIEVDSRVGEFTEFTVRLPRAYRAAMPEAAS